MSGPRSRWQHDVGTIEKTARPSSNVDEVRRRFSRIMADKVKIPLPSDAPKITSRAVFRVGLKRPSYQGFIVLAEILPPTVEILFFGKQLSKLVDDCGNLGLTDGKT